MAQIPVVPALYGVAAIDDGFAIAVGVGGLIMQWDGVSWSRVPSPVSSSLAFVWGDSRSDVWAGGGNSIVHWDGTSWTVEPFDGGFVMGLWGAPTGAWATTSAGIVDLATSGLSVRKIDVQVDGGYCAWCGPTWGTSTSDIWIATGEPWLLHVTDAGAALKSVPLTPSGVWGYGDDDFFGFGIAEEGSGPDAPPSYGFLEEDTDGNWGSNIAPASVAAVSGVWGACAGQGWALLALETGSNLGTAAICRITGSTVCTEELLPDAGDVAANAVAGSDHYVWVVGETSIAEGVIYELQY